LNYFSYYSAQLIHWFFLIGIYDGESAREFDEISHFSSSGTAVGWKASRSPGLN